MQISPLAKCQKSTLRWEIHKEREKSQEKWPPWVCAPVRGQAQTGNTGGQGCNTPCAPGGPSSGENQLLVPGLVFLNPFSVSLSGLWALKPVVSRWGSVLLEERLCAQFRDTSVLQRSWGTVAEIDSQPREGGTGETWPRTMVSSGDLRKLTFLLTVSIPSMGRASLVSAFWLVVSLPGYQ